MNERTFNRGTTAKVLSMKVLREAAMSAALAMGEYSRRKTERDVEPIWHGVSSWCQSPNFDRKAEPPFDRARALAHASGSTGRRDESKFIELAVQPCESTACKADGWDLENISELRKLSRISSSKTRKEFSFLSISQNVPSNV